MFSLKDDRGKLPIEYTKNHNIKKIIKKVMVNKQKKNDNNEEVNTMIRNNSNPSHMSIISGEFPFLEELTNLPKKPPKVLGYVEKSGRLLPIFRKRYMEVDPFNGTIRRFKSIEDYPSSPNEVIPLHEIQRCSKSYPVFIEGTNFNFEIICGSEEKYRVHSLSACDKWIQSINQAITYHNYWREIGKRYQKTSEYLKKQKKEIIFIDFESGEIKKYDLTDKLKQESEEDNKKRSNTMNNYPNSLAIMKKDNEATLLEDSQIKGIGFNSFQILELLGSGTFGKVYKVKLRTTEQIFAMKVIDKQYLIRNHQLRYAITECNILKQSNHPFIIKLHYSFQTPDYLYMILDYCPGGDLGYHLEANLFEEEETKFYIAELILAIEYLHKMNVIYRDLKPENILIYRDGHIKLADFGLAKENIKGNNLSTSFCGTPAYLAPEMVKRKGVGKSADIYGIGAVLYEMISGTPPFFANDINTLYNNIIKNKLMLHSYFSEPLSDLLKKLLNRDPESRIGIIDKEEIKRHEFFKGIDWKKLAKKQMNPPIDLVALKKEREKGKTELQKENHFNDSDYTNTNFYVRHVKNFTFVRPYSPDYDETNLNDNNNISN